MVAPYLANPAARRPQYVTARPRIDPLAFAAWLANQQAVNETESRYNDTLGGRQGVRDRVLGDLSQWGDSQVADTNERWDTGLKNDLGEMASRGLAGSSIRSSVTENNRKGRSAELRRVNDDIINRRVGADERTSDSIYGLMERRTDVQPDFNELTRLSQQLGQNGIGMGGRGGYFGGGMTAGGGGQYGGGGGGSQYGTTGPESLGWGTRPGYGPNNPSLVPQPYQAVPFGANGLDNPLASSVDRFNQRTQQNNPFGMGGYFGGLPTGGSRFGGRYLAPQQAPVAPWQGQGRQAMPFAPAQSLDPSGDAQRRLLASGADPWYSTPDNMVFNPQATLRLGGDPRRYGRTRTVQGANNAGANPVYANPITGDAVAWSQYQTTGPESLGWQPGTGYGGHGGYGGGQSGAVPYLQPSPWSTFGGKAPMRRYSVFGGKAPMSLTPNLPLLPMQSRPLPAQSFLPSPYMIA